jgi:glycosyltransferase involved in cell wall biosynthesis
VATIHKQHGMTPLVSVCVPNLNMRPFLKERFKTIFNQTFRDWELFVYDSFSDDGSWEFIEQLARSDARMRIAQGPREGVYPAWNACIRQTRGEYVYIATSDDGMAPDFLEKMVAALQHNPDCGLAHCPLVIHDERGGDEPQMTWPECTVFADGIRELLNTPHIRRAPYDGLIQLSGRHNVLSITQLLIRRSVFERVGLFTDRWGSASDFNWEMKAGLITDTVYVPDTWATWRIHPNQATMASRNISFEKYFDKVEDMIGDAVSSCEGYLPEAVATGLRSHLLADTRELRTYYLRLRKRRDDRLRRGVFQLSQLLTGASAVRGEILRRVMRKPRWTEVSATGIRSWLESLGFQPLIPCDLAVGQHSGEIAIDRNSSR